MTSTGDETVPSVTATCVAGKMRREALEAGHSSVKPAKLFIGGITRNTTTKQLRDHFSCYGKVLDCVAMRQSDGRPRGFGYVTLDSDAAADRCLAESQVIDGRVVDMKRAVPEGTNEPVPMLPSRVSPPVTAPPSAVLQHANQAGVLDWSEVSPMLGQQAALDTEMSSALLTTLRWAANGVVPPVVGGTMSSLDCVELLSRTRKPKDQPDPSTPWSLSSPGLGVFCPGPTELPQKVDEVTSFASTRRPVLGEITNVAKILSPEKEKAALLTPFAGRENKMQPMKVRAPSNVAAKLSSGQVTQGTQTGRLVKAAQDQENTPFLRNGVGTVAAPPGLSPMFGAPHYGSELTAAVPRPAAPPGLSLPEERTLPSAGVWPTRNEAQRPILLGRHW